jgi:flavin reductase (DIM6/NTAB) family NADH-FMN oxidoreductase RutF
MQIDSRELRTILGRFATGVCVITTVTPADKAVGLTANSFSSVSLEPPLVLWSLQNNSESYADFARPQRYAINILTSDQEALSTQYARKGDHELAAEHYSRGLFGNPILEGALASFECELETTHEAGDHLIIIGRVMAMEVRSTGDPLVFYSGAYRKLHGVI